MTLSKKAGRAGIAFLLAVMAAVGFSVVSASVASAAPDCNPSRFQGPDGLDVTGYLQCTNPSVSETQVDPGGSITFNGGGFKSNSSIDIVLVSTAGGQAAGLAPSGPSTLQAQAAAPASGLSLGTIQSDDSGNFSTLVTIPSTVEPGSYSLEARGVDPDGNPLTVSLAITVAAAGDTAGDTAATAVTPSGELPFTGSSAGRWAILGVALFGLGAVAVWGARRDRSTVSSS